MKWWTRCSSWRRAPAFRCWPRWLRQRKGTQQKELEAARRAGYTRVKVDGNLYDLDEEITLEKNIKHTVEVVVDRLVIRKGVCAARLADSLETALSLTGGVAEVEVIGGRDHDLQPEFRLPRTRRVHQRTDPAAVLPSTIPRAPAIPAPASAFL